jgi:hypothetical protein
MKYVGIPLLFLLVLALGACDGGSRGSGITTAEGTVTSVETALSTAPPRAREVGRLASWRRWLMLESPADAQSGVAGVRVLIEGTSIADETDGSGAFSLRGHFAGYVTVRFEPPGSGAIARISVNAPAGGVLTLDGVHIDAPSGQATAQQITVVFDGIVAGSDCAASMLQLVSRQRGATDTDVYDVDLAGSSIHDASGPPLPCQALRVGDPVHFTGAVNGDGTFGSAEIVRER